MMPHVPNPVGTVQPADRRGVRRLASNTAANASSKINSGNQTTHVTGEDQCCGFRLEGGVDLQHDVVATRLGSPF
jgi:hypothetical protein